MAMIAVFNLEESCLATPKKFKLNEEDSHLIVTGTIDDPFYVSSDSPERTTPKYKMIKNVDKFYKHKFLLKLRRKQYDNNFDLGLYFLIRFGGPKSSMGSSILKDDELLECSELSKFKNNHDIDEWFDFQYKMLYKSLRQRINFTNLSASQINRKMSRELSRKKWFTREKLYNKAVEQENWNPFSIFGSSLPYVSINDVFNLESSKNYIVGNLKKNIGREVGLEGDDEAFFNYLSEKWRKESKKVTVWNNDPLLTTEVLWYINSTNKYLDKSQNVCILQKCFCVTPNPNIRFNWNDPRCSFWRNYYGPRPSMGEVLANSRYKDSFDRFNCIRAQAQQSGKISDEDEIKLKYYDNYFRRNSMIENN